MKKGVVGRQQGVGKGEEIRARHLGKKDLKMNHRHDVRHWSRSTSKICVANRS